MTTIVVAFFSSRRKQTHRNKKAKEGRELTFLLMLLHLGWNTALAFSSPCSFNVELCTFLKPCVSCLFKVLSYSSSGALAMEWGGNETREVGRRENFWGREGGWKLRRQRKRMCFGSSLKQVEEPHLELVRGWLLVHSIPQQECNELHVTTSQYFWLVDHNDWSRWFAISSSPCIWDSSFSFNGGVAK
jgi:hypothetical protein